MKIRLGLVIAAWGILLASCRQSKREVIVYTTVDRVFSEPVLKRFEKTHHIKVRALYDTEETKSTGIVNRLIAEKNHPQCDVFWSGDPVRAALLKHKGITDVYRSPVAADIPAVFKDPDGHWTGFSARARVILYNKKALHGRPVPQSVTDLIDTLYRGSAAIANPLFGTTTFHLAVLFDKWGKEKTMDFLHRLKQNHIVIATSNGDVKNRVMRGEVAWGLTDTDDAFEAVSENRDVSWLFPDQQGMGTLIMPNTVSIIHGSPHPDEARQLMDFLLSRETEALLARSCAQMPLHRGVKVPPDVPSLDSIRALEVDYDRTALQLENIQKLIKKWMEN